MNYKAAELKYDLVKARIFFAAAFVSSFVFYQLMTLVNPAHSDSLPGRAITAFVSLVGFILSVSPRIPFRWIRVCMTGIFLAYINLYLYLMAVNDWSVFHRWSYFVVAAIVISSVLSWRSFLFISIYAFVAPVIASFWSQQVSALELFHFHAASFTTFFVIGVTVRSNFKYRDELIHLSEQAVQSSKMIALGQMSGGIAHEINNPLMVILQRASRIVKLTDSTDPQNMESIRESADKISQTVERIASIIKGLRSFSRESSGDPFQKVPLKDIVNATLNLCRETIQYKNVEMVLDPIPETSVLCRESQLIQVLLNVLNNAVHAVEQSSIRQIEIKFRQTGLFTEIRVLDSGHGIPRAIQNRIMEPFFTTKEVGKGTGLGLSICKGIVEAHGGEFYLDSQSPKTCFVMTVKTGLTIVPPMAIAK